jgi:hypothetical protein
MWSRLFWVVFRLALVLTFLNIGVFGARCTLKCMNAKNQAMEAEVRRQAQVLLEYSKAWRQLPPQPDIGLPEGWEDWSLDPRH